MGHSRRVTWLVPNACTHAGATHKQIRGGGRHKKPNRAEFIGGLRSVSYVHVILGKQAAAGVKRPNGAAGRSEAFNAYRRRRSRMSGLLHANLIRNLNVWRWMVGGGCMRFASALHKERDKVEWSTFPVHEVNASDSSSYIKQISSSTKHWAASEE